jgi:DNA topoisomerase I
MDSRTDILEYFLILQFGGKHKWKTLTHNGVLFPPEYVPHGKPLKYGDDEIQLKPLEEEIAMLYAKYITTDYVKSRVFNKNFWLDWKKVLGKNHIIQDFELCDFTAYNQYLQDIYEKQKTNIDKAANTSNEEKFKTAVVDDKPQPVGNFRMEPPGIFLGRGVNPKLGKVKRRIYPEDITINIGKESPIPAMPEHMSNHKWKKIIHDKSVEWLASWPDNITGKTKYMWLGAQSDFKAVSDQNKFDLARKLKKKIKTIQELNEKNMKHDEEKIRQTSIALYFIDKLALRVGNEKGEDETDTVGVTSLRVEHINAEKTNEITLDFLGKDSVRYQNTIQVEPIVYHNIKMFMSQKDNSDQLFDKVNASDINKYLQTIMKDLTAKVYRTYNASYLFQKEINKINKKYEGLPVESKTLLMDDYSKANAKVALLCNHQKNITKSYKPQIDKIDEQISKIKLKLRNAKKSNNKTSDKIKKIEDQLTKTKSKKELKMQLKNISLGTSKANYIDPRITVAFMKMHNLPVEKVFTKALQDKFKWAFSVDSNYKF